MQIVRRRVRPSLPEILREDPAAAALRAALRRIEREAVAAPGPIMLPAQTATRLAARPDWQMELERRTGRAVETAQNES